MSAGPSTHAGHRPTAVVVALLLAAGLAACEGDEPSTATTPAIGADADDPGDGDTSAAADGGAAAGAADGGAATTGAGRGSGDFSELARRGAQTPARIEYEVTGAGTDGTAYTYAQAAAYRSIRIAQGPSETLVVIDEDGEDATCIRAREDQWTCLTLDAAEAPIPPALGVAVDVVGDEERFAAGGWQLLDEDTIAGREATCAERTETDDGHAASPHLLCLARKDGVVLRMVAEVGSESVRFEARDVARPSQDDFALPAPPRGPPSADEQPPGH